MKIPSNFQILTQQESAMECSNAPEISEELTGADVFVTSTVSEAAGTSTDE